MSDEEWLVTDHRGGFAMGTRSGIRTRKYHGFYMTSPGRSETAYLMDLDIQCNGEFLWPHCYRGPQGPVYFPNPESQKVTWKTTETGPEWTWKLATGQLSFRVEGLREGGFLLAWRWHSRNKKPAKLQIRGFWAMRALHALGGKPWSILPEEALQGQVFRLQSDSQAFLMPIGKWGYEESPQWNYQFYYSEENFRGYPSEEDLFSSGIHSIDLHHDETVAWILAEELDLFEGLEPSIQERGVKARAKKASRASDFMLIHPAGIIAGYPWFGEWGRDTFIALPGILASQPEFNWTWAHELLSRWGQWIPIEGMLPNLIDQGGIPQWESSDATLWWCHSLTALWAFALREKEATSNFQSQYASLLNQAIESIRSGRHRFLKVNSEGLLEVTGDHSTWMDCRMNGHAVTPRIGLLPEINALWFQACCLQWMWNQNTETCMNDAALSGLKEMARRVLQIREPDRPNGIFLHSLPLAPSFFLKAWDQLEVDLTEIAQLFWTPAGLRTLSPKARNYTPHYVGGPIDRDKIYHQGPVWAWLGGHFEMAFSRYVMHCKSRTKDGTSFFEEKMFKPSLFSQFPIQGHIPEIFDAEIPYAPRGAPAQAWSLACLEEAAQRKRLRLDAILSGAIAALEGATIRKPKREIERKTRQEMNP